MSAPVLQAKSQSVDSPFWIAGPLAAPLVEHFSPLQALVLLAPRAAFDRAVTFHQLLI
jgi:hypothetical protein